MPRSVRDQSKIARSKQQEILARRQGLRHAIFNVVGDKYVGEWKDDSKTGKGAMLTRYRPIISRQLYEGDFLYGYRHGFGVLAYENVRKIFILEYRGGWKGGKMDGFGLRRYRDGGVYIGAWKCGKRHGYGLMWYPDGDFYAGDWVKDKRQGLGMLVRPDINRYEGHWFDDMKHGKGKFIHLDSGQMQRGVWNKDICVYSTMNDMKYRQTSPYATIYPIQQIQLVDVAGLCTLQEMKALEERIKSCLSFEVDPE